VPGLPGAIDSGWTRPAIPHAQRRSAPTTPPGRSPASESRSPGPARPPDRPPRGRMRGPHVIAAYRPPGRKTRAASLTAPTASSTNIKPCRAITASKRPSAAAISVWSKTAVLTRGWALARRAATATISGATSDSTTVPAGPTRSAAARPAPPGPAARSKTTSPSPMSAASSNAAVASARCSSTN
jgi:hypothetical protein